MASIFGKENTPALSAEEYENSLRKIPDELKSLSDEQLKGRKAELEAEAVKLTGEINRAVKNGELEEVVAEKKAKLDNVYEQTGEIERVFAVREYEREAAKANEAQRSNAEYASRIEGYRSEMDPARYDLGIAGVEGAIARFNSIISDANKKMSQINTSPIQLQTADDALSEKESMIETAVNVKEEFIKIKEVLEYDLKAVKGQLAAAEAKLENLNAEIEKDKRLIVDLNVDIMMQKTGYADIAMDNVEENIKTKSEHIAELEKHLGEVVKDAKDCKMEIDEYRKKIDEIQNGKTAPTAPSATENRAHSDR